MREVELARQLPVRATRNTSMRTFFQDLRYGLRMLAKNPGVTAVAVITLALGIGANTVVFSYVNAMLLRPFAFRDLSRAVFLWETFTKQSGDRNSVAPANFFDWRQQSKSFDYLSAFHGWDANLTGGDVAERIEGFRVTSDFFSLIGIAPQLGRTLAASDFHPGSDTVVVLSHGFWQRHLGADPAIVGKVLELNKQPFTVVAVMPEDFDFPVGAEAWAPLNLTPAEQAVRSENYLRVIGSLKPGVSATQAQADLDSIARRLAQEYPLTNAGHSVQVEGIVEHLTQGSRQFLSILTGAAFFVLLLACANVANLHLARATVRQREIAVRRALGAGRWQIARQILTESALIALLGGVAGIVFASWGAALLQQTVPPYIVQHIPGLKHDQIDSTVLAFTLIVALVAGILAGLAPAFDASRSDLNEVLKQGMRGGGASRGHNRLRALLVVSEVTLAFVLLVGAGVMVKGFRHLLDGNLGYDRTHVLTFSTALAEPGNPDANRMREFYDRAVERLSALPGVKSAAVVTSAPSSWNWNQTDYRGEGQPPAAPGEQRVAVSQSATPSFFRALKIPVVEGRAFTSEDGPQAPPVAVISASLAKRIWPDASVVGKRIRFGAPDTSEPWRTIVGVAADIKQSPFDTESRPTAYVPFDQVPLASATFIIRTEGDPLGIAAAARAQVLSADSNEPPFDMRTLAQRVSDNLSGVEGSARMMIGFGVIALVLAAAGIFALMAYSVSQRTHEIGIRLALGACPADISRMVVANAMKLAGIGLAIGIPFSLALTEVASKAVFGLMPMNGLVLAGILMLLSVVAAFAAYLPARRATKVDPMVALRYE
jgi:putative ABC transport system permease protein